MRLAVVSPPPTKPSEPGVSAGAATTVLRRLGVDARFVDASMGWHRFVLARRRLDELLERRRAAGAPASELTRHRRDIESVTAVPPPLRRPATYESRRVYTSAIAHLEGALTLVASAHPAVRLGVAVVGSTDPGERPESSAYLARFSGRAGPFDDYFLEELLPSLAGVTHVAISLTFQQQAPAAFRLVRLLAEHRPDVVRWVGGPLVACWTAAERPLAGPPFDSASRVVAGDVSDLAALASQVTGRSVSAAEVGAAMLRGPLAPPLEDLPLDDYLSPTPVVPAALATGCYWRRCTFCPDHLHGTHVPCDAAALASWLHEVAGTLPDGAMLHLTDSALPPAYLGLVADVIRRDRLPLRWHGFVRVEPELADPTFARRLADGGCALLQLGVETGSPRLARLLGKGSGPELARAVLRAGAAAGLRTHVYLLFGVPGETDADRELTLELVEQEAAGIHALNLALLNLPRRSPMHRHPARFGITELRPFGSDTDLSLYEDFRCGASHPRLEARRWLDRRFFKSEAVRAISADLRAPLKANHACFL